MKRFTMAMVVLASFSQSVMADEAADRIRAMIKENDAKIAYLTSGAAVGMSEELYGKVKRHEILMTDAINITRAQNGIDIRTPGHNAGAMSPAGEKELGQAVPELRFHRGRDFPDKKAVARERAAKRRANKPLGGI